MDWTTTDRILAGHTRKWIWTLIQFQIYPLMPVFATGTNKAGLKAPAFSPGCLRTGTNGPPRGPRHVLRLEDLWSRFVTRTGTKGPFGIKLYFLFWNFCIFFISLFLYYQIISILISHIKLDTYGSHSISQINYKYLWSLLPGRSAILTLLHP
jgi:hypothetical protein